MKVVTLEATSWKKSDELPQDSVRTSPPLTLEPSSLASLPPLCWGSPSPAHPASSSHESTLPAPTEHFCGSQRGRRAGQELGFTHHSGHCLHYLRLWSRWRGCLLSQASSLKLPCFACQLALKSCAVYQCAYFLWRKVSNLINAEFQLVRKQALSLTDED